MVIRGNIHILCYHAFQLFIFTLVSGRSTKSIECRHVQKSPCENLSYKILFATLENFGKDYYMRLPHCGIKFEDKVTSSTIKVGIIVVKDKIAMNFRSRSTS